MNWYRVVPHGRSKQDDGKYTQYLEKPEDYRAYDPALFFGEPLTRAGRPQWHQRALECTAGANLVFLDPDNGLETANMHRRHSAKEKHTTWQEVKDYYDRGQSVILYQHRPQMTKKAACIQGVLDFQNSFLKADHTLLLEYPRYTNRYYFFFTHQAHQAALEETTRSVARNWSGLCRFIDLNAPIDSL